VDFDQSPLQPVVMDIVQHGGNTPSVHLSALVYYSETEYVEPYRVISEDRLADFTKDFSDGIVISMIIPAGSFVYKLVPNRSTLIVEVTRSVDTYMTDTSERSSATTVERFKATMVNMEDDLANQYSEHALAEFKLDMFDFRVVRFQLLSEFVEKLRTVQIGTVHRYDSVADIIRTEMHKNLDKLEAKSGFEGVTMSGTPKETIDTQVIIPQGTRLVDLPKYLQESERGVYGSGDLDMDLYADVHKSEVQSLQFSGPKINGSIHSNSLYLNMPSSAMVAKAFKTILQVTTYTMAYVSSV
jgi:hypothetical protein